MKYLIATLLLVAVALFGAFPHAAMAGETPTASIPCDAEKSVMNQHSAATEHCGATDHSMSGACAIACAGTIATWFPSQNLSPLTFRPVAHRVTSSLLLHGRPAETAERPPKSI